MENKREKYIYEVSRPKNPYCEVYERFIICCDSEETARRTHPEINYADYTIDFAKKKWYNKLTKTYKTRDHWVGVDEIDELIIRELGKANDDTKEGIIMTE